MGSEHFPQMVGDLDALLRDADPVTPGMEKARAFPQVDEVPQLWMLGSSEDSAGLAAKMGLPYCFAYFINSNIRRDIMQLYAENFQPGPVSSKPWRNLCAFVICADSDAEAERLYKSRELWYLGLLTQREPGAIPSEDEAGNYKYNDEEKAVLAANPRHIIKGTPEKVTKELQQLAGEFSLDELMIVTITYDFQARCRSYELLMEAWNS